VQLTGGTAHCATSTLSTGPHSISAQYSGDANYDAAASSAVSQVVNAAPLADATSTLASSSNPSSSGQNVTFTMTVGGSAGTPTGTVNFMDGGTSLAGCTAVALGAGSAACSTAALAVGTHSITAAYSGDASYNAGVSNTVMQSVQAPPPADAPRLGAISTRMDVLTGDNVMIGGFIIQGSTPKTVVIRGRGPSLAASGVSGVLADPMLQLVRSSDQTVIATNDDWQSAPNAADVASSGFAPSDPKESAILVTLAPGAYTAIVSGVGNTTGVALAEVFEVDHPENPLAAISTRGRVGTGDNVLIGGVIVQGNGPQTVVIRARGPSLASSGVSGVLANPMLQIVRSSDQAVIATNDDWQSGPDAAQIQADGFAPGDPSESAVRITLAPGAYTAIVSGVGGTSGVAIVEVFPL
jgi:hypothetical protein